MANRTFIDKQYTLLKGQVDLYCAVSVGAAGAVTLLKWNYPQLGQVSAPARTYTAASATGGGFSFATRYAQGAEGVFSVARTGAGLWTVTLSDSYQRMVRLYGYATLAGGLSNIVNFAENSTISNMNSVSATGGQPFSVIGVALLSATGVAADPTSGTVINLAFTLQNNTEP